MRSAQRSTWQGHRGSLSWWLPVKKHIYKMAKAGLIPCFHVKGAIRFCPAELAEWIKKELEQSNQARNAPNKGNSLNYPT